MKKGQTTIEFIFIILIIIMYIFGVTYPIIENTKGIIEDIDNVSKTNHAAQYLNNTINKIGLIGTGSKENITLFIPKNSVITCQNNAIGFNTRINTTGNNSIVSICPNNVCEKKFESLNELEIDCDTTISSGIKKISVEKISPNKIQVERD